MFDRHPAAQLAAFHRPQRRVQRHPPVHCRIDLKSAVAPAILSQVWRHQRNRCPHPDLGGAAATDQQSSRQDRSPFSRAAHKGGRQPDVKKRKTACPGPQLRRRCERRSRRFFPPRGLVQETHARDSCKGTGGSPSPDGRALPFGPPALV